MRGIHAVVRHNRIARCLDRFRHKALEGSSSFWVSISSTLYSICKPWSFSPALKRITPTLSWTNSERRHVSRISIRVLSEYTYKNSESRPDPSSSRGYELLRPTMLLGRTGLRHVHDRQPRQSCELFLAQLRIYRTSGLNFPTSSINNLENPPDQQTMHFQRYWRCFVKCFPCWQQRLDVSAPPGFPIASVRRNCTLFTECFTIIDGTGRDALRITGPCCKCQCCGDVVFTILSAITGGVIGSISRNWSGILLNIGNQRDFFTVSFPMELDVNLKASILAATILIDFLFFEHKVSALGVVTAGLA